MEAGTGSGRMEIQRTSVGVVVRQADLLHHIRPGDRLLSFGGQVSLRHLESLPMASSLAWESRVVHGYLSATVRHDHGSPLLSENSFGRHQGSLNGVLRRLRRPCSFLSGIPILACLALLFSEQLDIALGLGRRALERAERTGTLLPNLSASRSD